MRTVQFSQRARLALSALASAFAMWLAAGFWHNDIGSSVLRGESNVHLGWQSLGLTFGAYLILSAIMARTYGILKDRRRTLWVAVRIGILSGLLWIFPHELLSAAGMSAPLVPVIVHALAHVVEGACSGAVMGLTYRLGRPRPADTYGEALQRESRAQENSDNVVCRLPLP